MSLRDQLQAIYDEHGKLTPTIIVDEARAESHSLHDRFEWDDAVAGEAWRHRQAHELIRSVRIVYREATDTRPEASVRAFHAVRLEDGYVYEPAEKVADDEFLRNLILRDMEREWQALKRRYAEFSEFLTMVQKDVVAA